MQGVLKDVCKQHNITLKELGSRLGKSKQYMSELAKGNIRMTYEMAVDIANVFGTTPDALFLTVMSNNIGHQDDDERSKQRAGNE